jgi:hypothetical protein
VDVAERQGGDVAALLAEPERLDGGQRVARGGVQLLVDGADHAVLLATDDADLDLQHDLRRRGVGEQVLGDLQVLVERHGGAVPHVRLEHRLLAARHPLLGDGQQGANELVELVLGAVVGVQRDVHRVVLGDLACEGRERHRARDHVLHRRAAEVLGAAGGDLHNAVALGLRESAQRRVQRLRRRDVDRRVGERAVLGAVEHLGVDLGSGDRHEVCSLRLTG